MNALTDLDVHLGALHSWSPSREGSERDQSNRHGAPTVACARMWRAKGIRGERFQPAQVIEYTRTIIAVVDDAGEQSNLAEHLLVEQGLFEVGTPRLDRSEHMPALP
ncbi:hypothetical protein Pth03_78270 [Planotetraspora thailandica]|uniref:Uncharacterized protein n=1 Tax=Planotetraspora thailandica TaxID=487172 RepID=A0A8J3Y223_9ACTN|nr:hypothetical protein [Planotetraspora thailandica]GII59438.1 hypothetical protein Pth03_78270 [Planotetraspora thailandica]